MEEGEKEIAAVGPINGLGPKPEILAVVCLSYVAYSTAKWDGLGS